MNENQNILVKNRSEELVPVDIKKVQEEIADCAKGLAGVDPQAIESAARIQWFSGIETRQVQDTVTKAFVESIDVDNPNATYGAARSFMVDHYHDVGRLFEGDKSGPYSHTLKQYLEYGVKEGRINNSFYKKYDLEKLNSHIVPKRDKLFTYLGIRASYDRYLLKDRNSQLFELPQHMFMAISMFLAQREENHMEWAIKFYDSISKFEFMLATPTLSNARTNRNQLSSCFQGSTPDNIEGIFDAYKDMAMLSKFGGGIGWDWTNVRSGSSDIDGHKGVAGGIVPWQKITNDIAIAVDQLGTRKGAIAVYLEPWHKDIVDFLDLKKNSGEERRRAHDLFPSLWINDMFMERVSKDEPWTLFDPYQTPDLHYLYGEAFNEKYKEYENDSNIDKEEISAKDLWKKILTSYFESGSPFLCFKDTANERNQNSHAGSILSSNLCTEIFQNSRPNEYAVNAEFLDGTGLLLEEESLIKIKLIDGTFSEKPAKKLSNVDTIEYKGEWKLISFINKVISRPGETLVCNLASVNLSKINTQEDMARVVPLATRILDNVIDLNLYPIKQAYTHSTNYRAIALGVMGEAQLIAESGIKWGEQEHLDKIDEIMEMFAFYALDTSADLAIERGTYPLYEGSNWSKGILHIDTMNEEAVKLTNNIHRMPWDTLRNKIIKSGIRNGYLLAIAPTSTISIVTGTTQAIEPVYKRKWYEENLSGLIPVTAPNINANNWDNYTEAYDVVQTKLIKAAAVRQKWLDQGQSLNVFIRLDIANGKLFNEIYMLAWKLGIKSTYYLRSESPTTTNIDKPVADRSIECSGCQ